MLLFLAAPAAAAADNSTFRVTASIEKRQISADGRFAVVGQAQRHEETGSADGRYVLKVTAATCTPGGDSLFGNGFENP
jgi:hypothetical protein